VFPHITRSAGQMHMLFTHSWFPLQVLLVQQPSRGMHLPSQTTWFPGQAQVPVVVQA
jgi:hypothetical protein